MSPALIMVWHLSLPRHGLRTMPADSCGMVHHLGLWSICVALWFLGRLRLEATRSAAFLCLRALELESPFQLRLEWTKMQVLRPFVTPVHQVKGYRTHGAIKAITEFSLYLNNLPTFHSTTVRENFTAQIETVNTPSLLFTLFLLWRKHQVKLEDDIGSSALNRLNSASNIKGLAYLQYLCWQITLLQLFCRPWEFPILLSWEWMFMKWKCGALWRSPWCKCCNKLFCVGLHSGKMDAQQFYLHGQSCNKPVYILTPTTEH